MHPPPQLVPADDLDAFPVEGHLHLPREPEGPVGGEADGHEGLGQDAFGKGDPGRPRGLLHEELPGVEEAGPVALPRLGAVEAPGLLGHHFFQPLGGDTADALQAEPPFHGLGQLVRLPEGEARVLRAPGEEALGEGALLSALHHEDLLKGEGLLGEEAGLLRPKLPLHLLQEDPPQGPGRHPALAPEALEPLLHRVGQGVGHLRGDPQGKEGLHQKPLGKGPASAAQAHENLVH